MDIAPNRQALGGQTPTGTTRRAVHNEDRSPEPAARSNKQLLLDEAATTGDVLTVLRESRLDALADQAVKLSRFHETGDGPEMNTASLREMAKVVVRNPKLRSPDLTLTDEGHVHAEWGTTGGGTVAMTFRGDGHTEFGAISAPMGFGATVLRIGGFHQTTEAIRLLQWHISRIKSGDDETSD